MIDDEGPVYIRPTDEEIIDLVEEIVEPADTGYTVRQFYYHLIAYKLLVPNVPKNYKWLVGRLTKLRKGGDVAYGAFVDRERASSGIPAEEPMDPEDEADEVASYLTETIAKRLHIWTRQPTLVRVAIEKKALQGVFEQACLARGVRLSPFKGSPSLTFLFEIGTEMVDDMEVLGSERGVILYYGDHDPTGMNIPEAAMNTILWEMGFPRTISLTRCGLNYDQATALNLPPDPAKLTDSRAAGYIEKYGHGCWELDAVPPSMLRDWVKRDIEDRFNAEVRKGVLEEDKARTKVYKARLIEEARRIIEELDDEEA